MYSISIFLRLDAGPAQLLLEVGLLLQGELLLERECLLVVRADDLGQDGECLTVRLEPRCVLLLKRLEGLDLTLELHLVLVADVVEVGLGDRIDDGDQVILDAHR